jgi:hypothetical protein
VLRFISSRDCTSQPAWGHLAIDHYPSAVFGMENALPHDRVHAIVARPDFEQQFQRIR